MNRWASQVSSVAKHPKSAQNFLPRNILILRHGRSLGNEDETLFARMPDWKIPLSTEGRKQAREAGTQIQSLVGKNAPLFFYVSPYRRTKETFDEVRRNLTSSKILMTREEPRLREQDFGNFQNPALMQQAKAERVDFGRFFYRFPDGESGADVFDRVAAFCGTFTTDAAQMGRPDATAVFITHGITARLFVKRWLHWSVDDFEQLHNPPNCGLLHLKRLDGADGTSVAYRLTRESRELIRAPKETGIGRALQLGEPLLEGRTAASSSRSNRETWESLSETAWGI
mmetsp:Transcript_30115/g.46167  ORF Transcript_30115/g.46167 Transcript_30115/m.46167 type:complete len:285 (+) Transcript_30115:77-931(+)|eukprot:CAMPEP_0195302452 /NCGR_PEP_ID=MMETSP0707-20130614/31106_1 /TAXON_ID=33640 /ORGANISM="Asterionellopsis glacialis, Strain CCMP134" /LENGTH=284 /DNA_ID=CAMNT_0040365715 /DNA_START=70 /DNA_END=924 /DNA_ORIENTATION=+